MDISKLDHIIRDCLSTVAIDLENVPDGVRVVDVHFFKVVVVMEKAESHRKDLIKLFGQWPGAAWRGQVPKLEAGPSYIHLGGVVGDQGQALSLMGIGEALGFWKVVTPAILGFEGEEAKEMAGTGMVMISGYEPAPV